MSFWNRFFSTSPPPAPAAPPSPLPDANQNNFNFLDPGVSRTCDSYMSSIEKCLAGDKTTEEDYSPGRFILETLIKSRDKFSTSNLSQRHWLITWLSIIDFVVTEINNKDCTDKKECLDVSQYIYGVAKQIRQQNRHIPYKDQRDITHFIMKGAYYCVSRIPSCDLSRVCPRVDVEEIKSLQEALAQMSPDLTLEAVTRALHQA